MKKILGYFMGVFYLFASDNVFAAEKFDILPDLPEPLAAAQASSVTTSASDNIMPIASQSIGHEPNLLLNMIFSLIFVIVLIYAIANILNKLGFNTLKKQMCESDKSKVSVVSTTPLGSNRTLHVVELDGKRMLIGASASSIQLIKDLGSYPSIEVSDGEYSKIEIPNIRIPKIEIPKIEFPNIGFTKTFRKKQAAEDIQTDSNAEDDTEDRKFSTRNAHDDDSFEISDIYEEESPDGIIDSLFTTNPDEQKKSDNNDDTEIHKVNPEDFSLYKKYL